MSKIFGGSKSRSQQQSTSSSNNQAFNTLNTQFSPLFGYATSGASDIQRFLGGDMSGFNNFKESVGFDFERDRGETQITNMLGSRGLRNSGAALKSLSQFNNNLRNQFANTYLDRLFGLQNIGLNAGQLVAGAGQQSQSQSTGSSSSRSYEGIGKFIGQVAAGVYASDIRLKENIKKIAKLDNGLGVYNYNYIGDDTLWIGVMAQEVEAIMPEALGPRTPDGYMTVNYDKINFEERLVA